ncbi:MAG: ROK family protein [Pirellulales bacterium]
MTNLSYFAGVDVGGTTSTVAIGDDAGNVLHVSEQFATRSTEGPQETVDAIVAAVTSAAATLNATASQIRALGLSTPGPASYDGILSKSPNLTHPEWTDFPIRAAVEAAFAHKSLGIGVHYIGDGQAAALGEYSVRRGLIRWLREGHSVTIDESLSSLFMYIVGTGLGGGEVRDGKVVRGRKGRAGHAGHLLLPEFAFRYEHDRQLVVGNATCSVESAVSLSGLTHQLGYRLTLDRWRDHPLNTAPGSTKDKAKQLRGLADQGDELALELFDDQAKALGIALLDVNYVGDYDLLVIGGGVCDLSSTVRERYRGIAEETYRRLALDGFRDLDRFVFSDCGDEAPVVGALAHAYAMSA